MKIIFKDITIQNKINKDGFVVLDLFSEAEIDEIRRASQRLIIQHKNKLPNRYFPVGQLNDFNFRNSSTDLIKKMIVPKIHSLFLDNSVAIYSGTHLVKPRGLNSFLSTHQDSSIVDETIYNSILFWCPLQPIHWLNGQLYILPGSHHFNNNYRSTTIPWHFSGCEKIIYKYSKPVKIKVGQICFFHSALIHHSGYNLYSKYRLAASAFITDKEATLLNYYLDKDSTERNIEVYEVDEDYYHNNNFNKRPLNQLPFKKINYNTLHVSQQEFKMLLDKNTLL